MSAYFVDTWYLIARADPHDTHHRSVMRMERLLTRAELVTHEYVFTEFLAFFAAEGAEARASAVATVRRAQTTFRVVETTRVLFNSALDLYARRPDKEYSFTDCLSMVIMRQLGIESVLTNDHHFRQEGFTVLSDAP